MDKRTFIRELRKALSVLQEDELEDIVSEYEQHIDMKQKNGLTEEEAIADFGSLNELASDILEAYHVRADYASESKPGEGSLFSGKKERKETLKRTKKLCVRAGKSFLDGIWSILLFCKKQAIRPFIWLRKQREERRERKMTDREKKPDYPGDGIEKASGFAFQGKKLLCLGCGLCRLAARAILWGIRMIWNVGWVCFALFSGGCGLFSLYMLGMLTVLLIQRYPLAGATLGCLGLVLCFFSAAGLGMTFLWRDRAAAGTDRPADPGEPEKKDREYKRDGENEMREVKEHV